MDFLVARDFSALLGQQDWSCSPLAESAGGQSCLHPPRTVGQVLTFTGRFPSINAFNVKRYLCLPETVGQDLAPTERFPSEWSTPRTAGQVSAPPGGFPSCRSYLCPPGTVCRSWGPLVEFLETGSVCTFLISRDGVFPAGEDPGVFPKIWKGQSVPAIGAQGGGGNPQPSPELL